MSIYAPYGFVTLSAFVHHKPEWRKDVSHDYPFEDGLSGEFEIEIKAKTKFLVGGRRSWMNGGNRKQNDNDIQQVEPFRLPDNKYAIPERSLRGMIRNVIEIATFSRIAPFVDDKRFGIRDLNDAAKPFYRDRLATASGNNPIHVAHKVKPGWLWLDTAKGTWRIVPCEMARVHFDELVVLSGLTLQQCQDRSDAKRRYQRWNGTLNRTLWVHPECEHPHRNGTLAIKYRKAAVNSAAGTTQQDGRIVLTGNAAGGVGPRRKKFEFFFYDTKPDDKALDVAPDVFKAFKDIHEPEDGRPTNPGWKYWENRNRGTGERIPVFYIIDGATKQVESFGLAMMFKLAHSHTTHKIICNTRRDDQERSDHCDESIVDMATAMFGLAADDESKGGPRGLKSRINMGMAVSENAELGNWEDVTVLSGPKASYFPSYVRQPVQNNNHERLEGRTYATYTPLENGDKPELRHPEIRGWKRYPAGRAAEVVDALNNPNNKIKVKIKPLHEGAVFRSKVRFHNLKPQELGALLWALEWGGRANHRHRLGMAKPYGFGQMAIRVGDATFTVRPNKDGAQVKNQNGYMADFVQYMDGVFKVKQTNRPEDKRCSWKGSEQINQLLAMADPNLEPAYELEYMSLTKFVNAKRPDHGGPFVLPAYGPGAGQCTDHALWPRPVPPVAGAGGNDDAPGGGNTHQASPQHPGGTGLTDAEREARSRALEASRCAQEQEEER